MVFGKIATYSTTSTQSGNTYTLNTNVFFSIYLRTTLPAEGAINSEALAPQDRPRIRPAFEDDYYELIAAIAHAGSRNYRPNYAIS